MIRSDSISRYQPPRALNRITLSLMLHPGGLSRHLTAPVPPLSLMAAHRWPGRRLTFSSSLRDIQSSESTSNGAGNRLPWAGLTRRPCFQQSSFFRIAEKCPRRWRRGRRCRQYRRCLAGAWPVPGRCLGGAWAVPGPPTCYLPPSPLPNHLNGGYPMS